MGRLRIMKISVEELRMGDMMLNVDGTSAFFIERLGTTCIHGHPYAMFRSPYGYSFKRMLADLKREKRTICRFEE